MNAKNNIESVWQFISTFSRAKKGIDYNDNYRIACTIQSLDEFTVFLKNYLEEYSDKNHYIRKLKKDLLSKTSYFVWLIKTNFSHKTSNGHTILSFNQWKKESDDLRLLAISSLANKILRLQKKLENLAQEFEELASEAQTIVTGGGDPLEEIRIENRYFKFRSKEYKITKDQEDIFKILLEKNKDNPKDYISKQEIMDKVSRSSSSFKDTFKKLKTNDGNTVLKLFTETSTNSTRIRFKIPTK